MIEDVGRWGEAWPYAVSATSFGIVSGLSRPDVTG